MKNYLILVFIFFFQIITSQTSATKAVETTTQITPINKLFWYNDLSKAVPISIKENKPIMLFFTGSDWCGWCMRLQREVFNFPKFKSWTDSSVVLVELDFPRRKKIDPNLMNQNRELARIFGVSGYPTVRLVEPQILESSKVNFIQLGKLGYVAGGPEKWISVAEKFLIQN